MKYLYMYLSYIEAKNTALISCVMHTLSPLPLCYLHLTTLLHTPSHPFPSTMSYPSHPCPSTMLYQPSHPPTLSPLLCYTHPPSSHSHPIYTHHTPSTQCSVGLYAVLYLSFHRWSSRSHGLSLSREHRR